MRRTNLLAAHLRTLELGVDDVAVASGLPASRVRALVEDAALLPTPKELEALCVSTASPVDRVIGLRDGGPDLKTLVGGARAGGERTAVCLVGLGNLTHTAAAVLSNRAAHDVEVRLLAVRPGRAARFLESTRGGGHTVALPASMGGGALTAHVDAVADDAADVVPGAALVLLCTPSHIEPAVLARIAPFLDDGAVVCSIPGPGGFHWAAERALPSSTTICGLASIPWMSKADVFGERARILGRKTITGVACNKPDKSEQVAAIFSDLLSFPVVDIQNFLQIILNPANQLLHPGILWDLFVDDDGAPLPEAPLFYESCTDRSAAVLEEMSDELLAIKRALLERRPDLTLSAVLPIDLAIRAAYGDDVADTTSLRTIIASNRAYATLRTPMVTAVGGLRPDWSSRFLQEDIPFGLVVVRGVADIVEVKTPAIDRVLTWSQGKMGKRYLDGAALTGPDLADSGAPARYGVTTVDGLIGGSS